MTYDVERLCHDFKELGVKEERQRWREAILKLYEEMGEGEE